MLGHGKHNLPDEQQQADPLVSVQCVRRDREDHGQHVVPDGGTLTAELTYTYNDYGLPVKLTYTDVDGETRTVREETKR